MRVVLVLCVGLAALAGCGGDDAAGRGGVVVTTDVLGDVVRNLVGPSVDVDVVLPSGADPHDFSPSPRQVEAMTTASLLVVNGAGFEAGLRSAIAVADDHGVEVFTAADHVTPRQLDGHDDPHLWTDPANVRAVAVALAEVLPSAPGLLAYEQQLDELDASIESSVAAIPPDRRVLVTNHEVLGYFADRYGFEVVGSVLPSVTTGASASAADVEDLADVLRREDVRAVFAEVSSSADLARALADEVGDVAVVELFAESLGPPGSGADTYVGMQRTNAERIAEALS